MNSTRGTAAPVPIPSLTTTPLPASPTKTPIAQPNSPPAPNETDEPLVTALPTQTLQPPFPTQAILPLPTKTPQPVVTPFATQTPQPVAATPFPTETLQPIVVQTPQPIVAPLATQTPQPIAIPLATQTPQPIVAPLPTQTPQPTANPLPTQANLPLSTRTPQPLPTQATQPFVTSQVQPFTAAPSQTVGANLPPSLTSVPVQIQKEPPPGPSVAQVRGTSLRATEKGLVVCGATLGAVLIVALLIMLYRVVKRVHKGKPSTGSLRSQSQHEEFPTFADSVAYGAQLSARSTYGPEPYTIGDLRLATDNFSEERVLGEGAFGKVFKDLHKKKPIAVKQMRILSGGNADREFRSELEVISRVHHRNLVKLLGFVVEEDQRYLVMEFIPNGTLYAALHPKLSNDPLDWACRRTVAIGIARGMAYLHDDCYPRIIHRDLKSSNILLDSRYEAQVADFGLAKQDEFSATQTHLSTRVMGTFGYMDPAYANTGRLTEESDVYSFGVVLLELINGRKAVDITKPPGKQSLVEWARPLIEKKMTFQLADSLLDSEYDEGELRTMIQVASNCTNALPSRRPGMKEVLAILQGAPMEQQAPAGQLTPVSEEDSSVMSGPLNASDLGARLARLQTEEDPYNQTVIDPERFSTGR
jgi:serine/threonine protein kinase